MTKAQIDTSKILEKYQEKSKDKTITNKKNYGPGKSMGIGLRRSSSTWC